MWCGIRASTSLLFKWLKVSLKYIWHGKRAFLELVATPNSQQCTCVHKYTLVFIITADFLFLKLAIQCCIGRLWECYCVFVNLTKDLDDQLSLHYQICWKCSSNFCFIKMPFEETTLTLTDNVNIYLYSLRQLHRHLRRLGMFRRKDSDDINTIIITIK